MLQDNPDMTQREIAEKLGISTSGLNYCLKALIDKGWVKVQNFSQSKNKFGYIYVLTPQGLAEKAQLTGRFLKRKMQEYENAIAEIEKLLKKNPEFVDATLLLADAKSSDSGSNKNSLIAFNLLGISLINPESIARTASISSAA